VPPAGTGRAVTQPATAPVSGDQRLLESVLHGSAETRRRAMGKVITLLESTRADHRERADALLAALLPFAEGSIRLGISGVPGVGKSTFIEALGLMLVAKGHRVAVLAVDPSSGVTGGAILGDKTRMERLSVHPQAFIRPSPSGGTLGGVSEKTREAILVCEAGGYDVVLVETVGTGQSESAVAGMTDMYCLLQLPNAGDDLQAIKRGSLELADLVVVNKADIDAAAAGKAQAYIGAALRLFGAYDADAQHRWRAEVLQFSALNGEGIESFWQAVERFAELQRSSGAFQARRRSQSLSWMWERIDSRLRDHFTGHPAVREVLQQTSAAVAAGTVSASAAARELLRRFASSGR
jgi:LAO/AO transport system kinase